MKYNDFIAEKLKFTPAKGINVESVDDRLYDFQQAIVKWSLSVGRCAVFAECGLGKTLMQLEWARKVPGDVLLLAPLAVGSQTVAQASKIGMSEMVAISRDGERKAKVTVANYDILHKFCPDDYAGIVLDESSILKNYDGKTRKALQDFAERINFRACYTATPAPNDYMELGTHSEFLGMMSRSEMLAEFFVHDGGDTAKWRLKGHAKDKFWAWVASWAAVLQSPEDIGFDGSRFVLPDINVEVIRVESDLSTQEGTLFNVAADLSSRIRARRDSASERCDAAARWANEQDGQVLVWCNLNSESSMLANAIDGAVEVNGSMSAEEKEKALLGFSSGTIKCIVTKPSIAGWGMNWQNCDKAIFVGLNDSYEEYHQAVRRIWRFGQKNVVTVQIVVSDAEPFSVENIKRKEKDFMEMVESMRSVGQLFGSADKEHYAYKEAKVEGNGWTALLGDSVERIKEIESDSVGFSIFSPPFASLYTYSNSDRDMGNCRGKGDFLTHFKYLVEEIYRVTMPGRIVAFHCMNLPTSKQNDGYIGIRDFRGDLVRLFEECGFYFHSEVTIWKDPVTAMQRTKAIGLLHKQLCKDSSLSRQGIPDYLCVMRKPGENTERIAGKLDHFQGEDGFVSDGDLSIDVWQRYASPVWMDINPSNTLQKESARENEDERHICPLQLDVIHRALQLWSNPNDLVLSPFMGIGSEGYESVRMGRRFIGCELKESYWKQAVANLRIADVQNGQGSLFD